MRGVIKTTALLTAGCIFTNNAQGQRVAINHLAGKYTPSHVKNGMWYPAVWRGSFFVNDGNNKVGDAGTVIQVSVWNGRNSKPGHGAADNFAKSVSVGQVCLMDLIFKPYRQAIRNSDGSIVKRLDGSDVVVTVSGWQYVTRSYQRIKDSDKQVNLEIDRGSQYAAKGLAIPPQDFFARPNIDFKLPNQQQNWQAYLALLAQRREIVFQGGETYGYALVEMPQGAQLAPTCPQGVPIVGSQNNGQGNQGNAGAITGYGMGAIEGQVNHAVNGASGTAYNGASSYAGGGASGPGPITGASTVNYQNHDPNSGGNQAYYGGGNNGGGQPSNAGGPAYLGAI